MSKLLCLLITSSLLQSCVSGTTIATEPPGAIVYINGQNIGKSPAYYSDSKPFLTSLDVRIKKTGCETFHSGFSRSEEIDPLPAITGFCFFFPWLWAMKYRSYRTYELECGKK
jgi:hypothetical protein